MRMENSSGSGGNDHNGEFLSELCDSNGFLGWDPKPKEQRIDDGGSGGGGNASGGGSTEQERGSTPNNSNSNSNSSTTNNNTNNTSNRFGGLSKGLSNRTILIDGRYIMCSERSLSVNSECSGVTTDEGEQQQQQNQQQQQRQDLRGTNKRQASWKRRNELLLNTRKIESIRTLDSLEDIEDGDDGDDDTEGMLASTRSVVLGARNDEDDHPHMSSLTGTCLTLALPTVSSSGQNEEEETVAAAVAPSSSTTTTTTRRLNLRGELVSQKESIRSILLDSTSENAMDETTKSSSSSSRREDRRGAYAREESTRTLDESVYSVDSKGFMAWKMDHRRRGVMGGNNREDKEESVVRLDDPSSSQKGKHRGGGGEGKGEEEDGLLVEWENNKLSLNSGSCNNDGESNESDAKNEGDVKLMDATSTLTEAREISTANNDETTSDFCPAQIKLQPSESGKRLSRQMRDIVPDKLSSSVPSQPSTSTRSGGEEQQDNLASSLPLPSDLSDTVLSTENDDDDRRRRGFGTNREESTRTFDSWAQTVSSTDDKSGGLLVDWDLTITKRIKQLSLNASSDVAADGGGAHEGDGGGDDNDAKNKSDKNDIGAAFPKEITEALDALDSSQTSRRSSTASEFRPAQITLDAMFPVPTSRTRTRSSSVATATTTDFQPAQITLENDDVGNNSLSNRVLRMSKRLSSSLSGHTSTSTTTTKRTSESWNNLASSLSSELGHRASTVSTSWSVSSDHGLDNATFPSLSSSLREGDTSYYNRPIRIGREDNVNIEELRRELLLRASSGGENDSPRRKSSLLGFR